MLLTGQKLFLSGISDTEVVGDEWQFKKRASCMRHVASLVEGATQEAAPQWQEWNLAPREHEGLCRHMPLAWLRMSAPPVTAT